MNKGREFLLYKTRSNHRLGGRDNWTVREGCEMVSKPHSNPHLVKERIHVIEYQAYKKAVDCIRKMVDLREEACHDLGEKTLKELGEHD